MSRGKGSKSFSSVSRGSLTGNTCRYTAVSGTSALSDLWSGTYVLSLELDSRLSAPIFANHRQVFNKEDFEHHRKHGKTTHESLTFHIILNLILWVLVCCSLSNYRVAKISCRGLYRSSALLRLVGRQSLS